MVRRETSSADLAELGEEIAALAAHLHAVTYLLLVRLGEFDARDGWSGGFRSCAHWLSWRTGIDLGAAREKVRVARVLAALPGISDALRRGALSYAKVRALTRVATPENEAALLEVARHGTAAQVEQVVRAWRRVDRLEEAERDRRLHEARFVTLWIDDDGSYVLRGRLAPEAGALLEKALEAASFALQTASPHGREDERIAYSPAQRRADALAQVAADALRVAATGEQRDGAQVVADSESAAPARAHLPSSAAADRYQVVVHVDADALREGGRAGESAIAGGPHVSAEGGIHFAPLAPICWGEPRAQSSGRRPRIPADAFRIRRVVLIGGSLRGVSAPRSLARGLLLPQVQLDGRLGDAKGSVEMRFMRA